MLPEQLDANFYNVCYYYACSGDAKLDLPYEFAIGDEGEGLVITWWGYQSPKIPSYAQLLEIQYEVFLEFQDELEKQQKIKRIMLQDDYPILDWLCFKFGYEIVDVMNEVL
jgi:hypothetical protein